MVDIERWVKLGWARSYFLKWDWMLLEQAVLQYTLKKLVERGFIPMQVPNIVNPECLIWTWYFPGWEEDAYWMERDDQWLIWTSEIPVTSPVFWFISFFRIKAFRRIFSIKNNIYR